MDSPKNIIISYKIQYLHMSNQTPQFQQMLEISNIEADINDKLQNQINRLQDQLKQTKEELEQKRRLIDIQKRTNQALESQQKKVKARSITLEERITTLESQLRNQQNQTNQPFRRLKSHETELQDKLSSLQIQLQTQKNRNSQYDKRYQQVTEDLKRLEKQYSTLLQQRQSQDGNSRESDLIRLQLEEEKEKAKKLTKQVQNLQSKNEELSAKLKTALNSQKQTPIVQTKTVEAPPKIVEIPSKQAESEIKKLQDQLRELKHQNAIEKEKAKKAYEKQIQDLKSEAKQANQAKESLKFIVAELKVELQRVKNGENSMSQMFPSSINLTSRIMDSIGEEEDDKMKKNINAEEIDEDSKIKINKTHKGIINALNKHLTRIRSEQVISFLSVVGCWAEEHLQRIESNFNELNQG